MQKLKNIYFEKLFESSIQIGEDLPVTVTTLTTIDSTLRSLQYNILNKVFFLNENYTLLI